MLTLSHACPIKGNTFTSCNFPSSGRCFHGLHRMPACLQAQITNNTHTCVTTANALAQMRHFIGGGSSTHQSADDLERLPGMYVVVCCMELKPAQAARPCF